MAAEGMMEFLNLNPQQVSEPSIQEGFMEPKKTQPAGEMPGLIQPFELPQSEPSELSQSGTIPN